MQKIHKVTGGMCLNQGLHCDPRKPVTMDEIYSVVGAIMC